MKRLRARELVSLTFYFFRRSDTQIIYSNLANGEKKFNVNVVGGRVMCDWCSCGMLTERSASGGGPRLAGGGGRVRGAHRALGAAVLAPARGARASSARRPAAGLPPRLRSPSEPRARARTVPPLRERKLYRREEPQVYHLPRRRFPVERQAAAILREHELRGANRARR